LSIIFKQSFWNTAVSYLGVILGAVNLIWLFPTVLGDVQFGVTRLLLSGSLIAAQFAHLGMGNVTYRFFPQFEDRESGHHGFMRLLIGVPFIGFLITVGAFYLFRDSIGIAYATTSPVFVEYNWFMIPLVGFHLYFNVFDAWLRSMYRTVAGSLLREVVLRLFQTLSVIAYWLGWLDFHSFIIAFTATHAIATLILAGWTIHVGAFQLGKMYSTPEEGTNKEIGVYATYAILGGISSMAVMNVDLLMVGAYLGEAKAGYYAIAFFIGTFISIPERSLTKISYPVISQAFKDQDFDLIKRIYQKTSLNQLIIGLLILIGIWVNMNNAVKIIPGGFEEAKYVMVIICFAKLVDMATGANSVILLNSPWYRFDLSLNVMLLILTIGTNMLLIPKLGLNGAAIASLVTIVIYNVVKLIYIKHKMGIQPFELNSIKVIMIGIISYSSSLLLPTLDSVWIDIIFKSSVILIVYVTMVLSWKISEDMNQVFTRYIRKGERLF